MGDIDEEQIEFEKKMSSDINSLVESYNKQVQWSSSIEHGLNVFNLAAINLEPFEIEEIRDILNCIANQFSEPEKSMEQPSIDALIKVLASKAINGKIISAVFRSLSEIPPYDLYTSRAHKPHVC